RPTRDHGPADALAGQGLGGLDHLVQQVALLLASRPRHHAEERVLADLPQRAAQLGLEEHDESEHPEGPEVVEDPAGAVELEPVGEEGEGHEGAEPEQHLDGPRLLEHDEDAVEDERDQADVDRVPQAEGLQLRPHAQAPSRERRTASATRTAWTVSPTSWARTRWAPPSTAAAAAASDPGRRRAGSASPATSPTKD